MKPDAQILDPAHPLKLLHQFILIYSHLWSQVLLSLQTTWSAFVGRRAFSAKIVNQEMQFGAFGPAHYSFE